MFIMVMWEVPMTMPRFNDLLEELTGFSIQSYLQLRFNTEKGNKAKPAKEKGTWGKTGNLKKASKSPLPAGCT